MFFCVGAWALVGSFCVGSTLGGVGARRFGMGAFTAWIGVWMGLLFSSFGMTVFGILLLIWHGGIGGLVSYVHLVWGHWRIWFDVGVLLPNTWWHWGGISLVHLAGEFGWLRFGVFNVDCRMDGSYCLVHFESGRLRYHYLFGVGVLYPGVSSDWIWQKLVVLTAEDSSGVVDAADRCWQHR